MPAGSYRYVVAKGESGCNSASYGIYTGANGGLAFYVYNGHGDSYVVSPDASTSVWDGNWHLVVGTYDGSDVRVFVDGSEIGSGSPRSGRLAYPSTDTNDLFIGAYPRAQADSGCQAGGFLGLIDEVTIWSRALSPSDVSSMMSQTGAGSTGGGSTSPGGSGPPGGSGTEGPKSDAPEVGHVRVAPSVANAGAAPTISYTLTQTAHLNFAVQIAQSGTMNHGRCVKGSKGQVREQRCARFVTVARFARSGKAGSNRLRFAAQVWRKLRPHRYRLEVTPSAHGQTGRTVSTMFTIR